MLYYLGHIDFIMPFTKAYPHLGHTVRIRIPESISTYVSQIVSECDRVCGTDGEERVLHILEKIIEGLENC